MSELQKAFFLISGKHEQRGQKAAVARAMGITRMAVNNWFSRGIDGAAAVSIWKASGRRIDLVRLVEEGEEMKRRAA
ncbi:hypothetical protein VSS37_03290 [Candidatus Thiothrix sp. Deng01]|uniref:Helix-turn-helix domain-containing protein n=1 Tax=Candidatus Thiothrix phosphatis TaxID=3112415 RepID=A0ABU6CTA4_9GAMM|nr:hypothetical protein [Candidatus Thiothrix sp. Deng01]MEB4589994.1 hypothetical protein [Candidatus Thiothrix sp. Deng01]